MRSNPPPPEISNRVKQPKKSIGVFLREPFSESQACYRRRFLASKADGAQEFIFKESPDDSDTH